MAQDVPTWTSDLKLECFDIDDRHRKLGISDYFNQWYINNSMGVLVFYLSEKYIDKWAGFSRAIAEGGCCKPVHPASVLPFNSIEVRRFGNSDCGG